MNYSVLTLFIIYPLHTLSKYFPSTAVNFISLTFPYVLLGGICYGLDAFFLSVQQQSIYVRAVIDNCAHGVIAFISWCVASGLRTRKDLVDAILCGLIACSIDFDHFIAAKSFRLQDALHLENRPCLHSTTVVFIVVPIVQVLLAQNISYLQSLPYLFAVAVVSHHLRDGCRRGLWFWPLGSTPPIPYWAFITYTVLLPCFVKEVKRSLEKVVVIPTVRQPLLDV